MKIPDELMCLEIFLTRMANVNILQIKRHRKLKQELKGYKNVSKSMRRMLSEMGFIIEEEGKHYKLIYYGDPRYWTTLAKTPSDIHTGENEALTIIRKMF